MVKSGEDFFMNASYYERQLQHISAWHLIFEIIRRCVGWLGDCHFVVWLLGFAWPLIQFAVLRPLLLLLRFLDGTAKFVARGPEQRIVDVEVMLLSGETVAKLTMPNSTTVRELRKEVALRSTTRISAGHVRLLFGETVLSDDLVMKNFLGEADPSKCILQLIHRGRRNFVPSKSSKCSLTCKILLLGDSGTGKTNIMDRFAVGMFTESFISTIGIDFKIKQVACDEGIVVKLQIWDTAGQERFRKITQAYFRTSDAVILVYDVSVRESFEHLSMWLREVRQQTADALICLVANKTDLIRLVPREEAEEFASNNDLTYFEVSAKTDTDVYAPFHYITDVLMERAGL